MKQELKNKSIVIIGATGGLGQGFAKLFAEKGGRLLLAGRNIDQLNDIKNSIQGDVTLATVDVTDPNSVNELAQIAQKWAEPIDIVINVTGKDIRKSLNDHTHEEIKSSIDINLMGTILITQAFIPLMRNAKESGIVNIGGFADGRMAFPYYSVDVATRAGVYSFVESINRELAIEGKATRVIYFCPSPADTAAERPFHELWRKMGIKIVSVETVGQALLNTLRTGKQVGIMGGSTTVLFAKINAILPQWSDQIVMKKYGVMLKDYIYPHSDDVPKAPKNLWRKVAIVLVMLSFLFYGVIFAVPFLPLSTPMKATLVPLLIASGEATWWVGVALVGKQAISKYRKYWNPCQWGKLCRTKN